MDETVDLKELRATAPPYPVRPLSSESLARRRSVLMRALQDSPRLAAGTPPEPIRPGHRRPVRNRRRLTVLAAAAVLVLGATATTWALVASSARQTVSVECVIRGSDTIIPSATGRPVADCAAQWRRDTGTSAPRLIAYDNGVGGITVLPASQTPPRGFTRLPQGATQDVSMVVMQQWLDDYVSGLNSGCYGNATAVAMTRQELGRLGMANWTVRPAPDSDFATSVQSPSRAGVAPAMVSSSQNCVGTGILFPDTTTVQLRALSGPIDPGSVIAKLAGKLRAVAQHCGTLNATARGVRSAAHSLGLTQAAHQYELTMVPDGSLQCTSIAMNVGGTIFLILRGPAA
ncbi:MAG TPA: hypothetical protein VGH10_01055 [Actinomycetota bacterium]|jgi:hypothetical protein